MLKRKASAIWRRVRAILRTPAEVRQRETLEEYILRISTTF